MKCHEVRKLLSAYFDRQLSGNLNRQVIEHLAGCEECSEETAAMRETSRLIGSLPSAQLLVDLAPMVVAKAAKPGLREYWQEIIGFVIPHRRFIVRQIYRAAMVAGLFMLAVNIPGRGPSDLIFSWPAKVASAPSIGAAYINVGMAHAKAFIAEMNAPSSRRSSEREKDNIDLQEKPGKRFFHTVACEVLRS